MVTRISVKTRTAAIRALSGAESLLSHLHGHSSLTATFWASGLNEYPSVERRGTAFSFPL
ncbi:hypothetical protein [Thermococcus sp. 21S7]|uniref:hypothetical protein n=1 Tax=Thermococcus sp. 21S7 TaxID=1638221 RepID=UPI00143A8107|nr:hypothetical protein [Thermococcus sp. 21S7]NJE60730.1 hypothetical protein [Thermococcus sp. 21S7]